MSASHPDQRGSPRPLTVPLPKREPKDRVELDRRLCERIGHAQRCGSALIPAGGKLGVTSDRIEDDLQRLRGGTLSARAGSPLSQASAGKPEPTDVRSSLLKDANLRMASLTEAMAAQLQILKREAASILERNGEWRRSHAELEPPPQAPVPVVGASFDSTVDEVHPPQNDQRSGDCRLVWEDLHSRPNRP